MASLVLLAIVALGSPVLVDVAQNIRYDGGRMDLSGKLVKEVAVIEGGLTPEQAQELAVLYENQDVAPQRWRSFEDFIHNTHIYK